MNKFGVSGSPTVIRLYVYSNVTIDFESNPMVSDFIKKSPMYAYYRGINLIGTLHVKYSNTCILMYSNIQE